MAYISNGWLVTSSGPFQISRIAHIDTISEEIGQYETLTRLWFSALCFSIPAAERGDFDVSDCALIKESYQEICQLLGIELECK